MPLAARFSATLVDEWCRAGVTDAVVAPGSRSTPLVLAIDAEPRLRTQVFLDERAAGFFALGLGLATGRPAVVVTTSGTAAAELHPAVVEAHHAGVPLLACTADRPAEARDIASPQTIDQTGLFGSAVRWFAEPGVPDASQEGAWRSLAARAFAEAVGATSGRPGPVHLNLAFREPLVDESGPLPPARDGVPWHRLPPVTRVLEAEGLADLARLFDHRRGIVVAGAGAGEGGAVHALAAQLGWPVLADPRSDCRFPAPTTVGAFDSLLRYAPFAHVGRPQVVLRLGQAPASKVLSQWLASSGALQVAVDAHGSWVDPDRTAAVVVAADPTEMCRALTARHPDPAPDEWATWWGEAERLAQTALEDTLVGRLELNEPALARDLVAALPAGSTLVVASSMPIRDVEWFARPRRDLTVLANRGANGIDGMVSTILGVAASDAGRPTVGLLGDLAFLHDSGGLLGVSQRGLNCVFVVVDNHGGGIFSFLPQATALTEDRFERLFGTPQDVDLAQLARLHGVSVTEVSMAQDLGPAVRAALSVPGVGLVLARTERHANLDLHDDLHAAVAAAVDQADLKATWPTPT